VIRRGLSRRAQSAMPGAPSAFSTTAAIIPQRVVPILGLLVLESFAAAGMGVALLLARPGWYGAVVGFGIALVFVVRIRGATVPSRLVGRLVFWWERRRRMKVPQQLAPFDVQLVDGKSVGFHWDGKVLTSLMRIEHNPQALNVIEPTGTLSAEHLSVHMLGECLRQFDITLDSIDVISQGARSRGHGQIAASYERVLGPLPAVATRSVWVTVRLDPTRCAEAVRHRGGGWEGALKTAAVATRRVANRLSDAGLRPQLMTARDIELAADELSDGVGLATLEETWLVCRRGRFQLRSFVLRPSMFTSESLNRLWTVPSYSTTVCLSLRRDAGAGPIMLRGLARFGNHGRTRAELDGLGELRGRQYAALLCSLPVPSPRRPLKAWVIGKGEDAADGLELPAYGCGQLIGADERGRAVALPLFGPGVGRVEMRGTLHLAQQVVLRSMALGARVRVHTGRAAAWRAMVDQVGDESFLRIEGQGRGPTAGYSVEMFDGVAELPVRHDVTTMIVNPAHATASRSADVTLELLNRDHDVVRVETRTRSMEVTMVASDDEMRYLESSFTMVD
jgi:type VII secretion protein EccE